MFSSEFSPDSGYVTVHQTDQINMSMQTGNAQAPIVPEMTYMSDTSSMMIPSQRMEMVQVSDQSHTHTTKKNKKSFLLLISLIIFGASLSFRCQKRMNFQI